MRSKLIFLLLTLSTLFISACGSTQEIPVDYFVQLEPRKKVANVELRITNANLVKQLSFNLKNSLCSQFKSTDALIEKDDRLIWSPTEDKAVLRYSCKIDNSRKSKNSDLAFDAHITNNWAIFRGDDLVPAVKSRLIKGANTKARLIFDLPSHWSGVNTGWERAASSQIKSDANNRHIFYVDNPERNFDRPTGWMIAGKLGTRRVKYDKESISRVAVSAPADSSFKQMDALTFIQFIWPEFIKVCGHSPKKILVVGGDDPMWRGGLSAGNSFFMHADRPLVSENGTSTLIHEMFHMCTRIRGANNADWIAEGLAEFYSLEILRRAGGLNKDRHARSINSLSSWAKSAGSLQVPSSKGATTAKAVLLFIELDKEIKDLTDGKHSLDQVVHELMKKRVVSLVDLRAAFNRVTGKDSLTLEQVP